MRQIFKLTFLTIVVLFISCNSKAQQKDNYSTKIDSLLTTKSPRSFNGVVFIQQNGKLKYAKAYGLADINKKTVLKIDDKFSTMSIAKQITATLILQEVEKGTIDLHTPIRSYLPDFQYSWADSITVHQLINHTSGLYADELKPTLKQKPNLGFSYSNVGYSVLGKILEKKSRKTFETLVAALFKKCKMKNCYYPNESNSKLLIKGQTIKKDGTTKQFEKISFTPDQYWGSHLIVTAPDLAKWNECLHNEKLLKPATYKLMTNYSITNTHPLFGKNPIGYGYGLRINDKADIYEIGHTGFHPAEGFTAVNLYYPMTKTSIIVMENQANENFEIAYYFEQEIRKIILNSDLVKKENSANKKLAFSPKIIYQSDDLTITQLTANTFQHQSFLQTQNFGKVPCNGMIVRDHGEAIIFDTTSDSLTSSALIKWMQEKLHCKINAVVPTHFHTDNLGGLKAFEQAGVPSYASFKTIEYAKENNENVPQNGFDNFIDIKVGNNKVVVKFFGEGHTRDNTVAYFPNEEVLFGGCLIKELNASKGYLADANENDWSATVTKIKKSYPNIQWVIPGHGQYGDKKLLDYTIQLFKTH